MNRLEELVNVKGSGASAQEVSRFGYRLRADGRRDKLTETLLQPDGTTTSRSIEYSFDDANRLTGEVGTDGSGKNYSKSYQLDEAGNRRKLIASHEVSGTTTTNYSYNTLDWMTQQEVVASGSTTTTGYDYDANGAQTGIKTQVGNSAASYIKQQWDFEGHLVARGATNANGDWGSSRNEYSYDAAGMRLSQSTVAQDGTTSDKTSYLWQGDKLLEERDEVGYLRARYEHGQELGPLSMLRPARVVNGTTIPTHTRYFIGDGQDSIRQLTDEAGVIKDSYFYDSFGVDLNGGQATTANSFKYTGQQQDASGLYYLRARHYDAGSGRFLSHDPLLGHSDDPITMHRYLYANADPANFVDPSGREGIASVSVSMGIGATLGAMGSGVDGYLQGHRGWDLAADVGTGAVVGAAAGRLSGISAFTHILWGLGAVGTGLGANGAYDAYQDGNTGLAAFRSIFTVISAAALAKTAAPISKSNITKVNNWFRNIRQTNRLLSDDVDPLRGTGVLRRSARNILDGEDILLTAADGLQSRMEGLFQNVRVGAKGDPESTYLWTIDKRGINICREKTPWPTPRGNVVHSNISEEATIGGEAWFDPDGSTVTINAGSGRFGDGAGITPGQWNAAADYWRDLGYEVIQVPYGSR